MKNLMNAKLNNFLIRPELSGDYAVLNKYNGIYVHYASGGGDAMCL